jgi:pimeloyl-ACP methyl ester carboxylesterase
MLSSDLHELLQRGSVPGPYILVGHSIGGGYVRIFASRFPSEVAGLVVADSSSPDQHEPPIMLAPINRLPVVIRRILCAGVPLASRFGLMRIFMRNDAIDVPPQFASDAASADAFRRQRVKAAETDAAQSCAATNNGAILPDGDSGNPEIDQAAQQIAQFHQVWVHQLQPDLAHLSKQGRQIIVENSDHGIPDQAPSAVVAAIRTIVTQLRPAPAY